MKAKSIIGKLSYEGTVLFLQPFNFLLSFLLRNRKIPKSVLHISYMVHIPYFTVQILRRLGVKADYLAIGVSSVWGKCDYNFRHSRIPPIQALREFIFFWRVVSRYELVHSHFMITLSRNGWELYWLKNLGRKLVIHYRGCEIRDRRKNEQMHPEMNICQSCDYDGKACTGPIILLRRNLARKYGDYFLVTTPDLQDFSPDAKHFPFFSPEDGELGVSPSQPDERDVPGRTFRIVHATNHPGIEGTAFIERAIQTLQAEGYPIDFRFLRGESYETVLKEYAKADLAIGKMKMGYYANAQIEAMFLGVPVVTYVRPEFMSAELESSGFIFADLTTLEQVLRQYLSNPDMLEKKRAMARSSITSLHSNDKLGKRLIEIYESLH